MKTFSCLEYSVDNAVAIISLNSPDGMNTQTPDRMAEWIAALELANRDESIGAILFTSAGRIFSAGADLENFFLPKVDGKVPYDTDDDYTGGMGLLTEDWVRLLRESKPVIVAFNGAAVGGGATVFLAADVLVASDQASFHFPFVKLGIVPELCSSRLLPARIGFGRASEILLRGRALKATEALELGLIEYVFPAEALREEALAIAREIAANPSHVAKMIKQLIGQNALEPDFSAIWKRESDALRTCFGLEEHKQAVRAFLNNSR